MAAVARWPTIFRRASGVAFPHALAAYAWLAWQELTFAGLMSGTYFPGLKITAP
jgi:hypothetical protein